MCSADLGHRTTNTPGIKITGIRQKSSFGCRWDTCFSASCVYRPLISFVRSILTSIKSHRSILHKENLKMQPVTLLFVQISSCRVGNRRGDTDNWKQWLFIWGMWLSLLSCTCPQIFAFLKTRRSISGGKDREVGSFALKRLCVLPVCLSEKLCCSEISPRITFNVKVHCACVSVLRALPSCPIAPTASHCTETRQ